MLVETVSASELTDPQVGSERLLYRLFHERGVRIYEAGEVRDGGSFNDRMGAVACWNAVMDENQYMVRKWNEFIAA